MKALLVQMIDLDFVFQFFMGRCHGNQIKLGEINECRPIQHAIFALKFENETKYHYM